MSYEISIDEYFQSLQQGEEKGFAYFFHEYYKALYYFATRLLPDDALAEDAVEESFIKLYEKRNTIQSAQTIKGFLYTTVRHACLDKLAQQKSREVHHQHILYAHDKSESSSFEDLIKTETWALVLKAMEDLTPATKKVFQLHYLEGKSYEEIATQLGRSKETIRKQKQQGLIFLRKKLIPVLISIFIPGIF